MDVLISAASRVLLHAIRVARWGFGNSVSPSARGQSASQRDRLLSIHKLQTIKQPSASQKRLRRVHALPQACDVLPHRIVVRGRQQHQQQQRRRQVRPIMPRAAPEVAAQWPAAQEPQ
jgi:hypothetical protein